MLISKSTSPIFGTLIYIWGAMSIIISSISYLFDAYPPRATLSALTAAASFRLVLAAVLPLVIIQSKHSTPGASIGTVPNQLRTQ